jgi:hypothetical protein
MAKKIDVVDNLIQEALKLLSEESASSETRMNNIQIAQAKTQIAMTLTLLQLVQAIENKE